MLGTWAEGGPLAWAPESRTVLALGQDLKAVRDSQSRQNKPDDDKGQHKPLSRNPSHDGRGYGGQYNACVCT